MRRDLAKRFGRSISLELADSERAVDLSLIANMRMSASLIEARLGLGMNITVRNKLVQAAGSMIAADLRRRNQLIELHAELAEIGERLGLDTTANGDGGDKKENFVLDFPLSATGPAEQRQLA